MEAKAFLKTRCIVPSIKLSTYLGFATTSKRSEEILQKIRVSFHLEEALVSADADTRREVLERMEIGARIDTKKVSVIERPLADAKLPPEALTAGWRSDPGYQLTRSPILPLIA